MCGVNQVRFKALMPKSFFVRRRAFFSFSSLFSGEAMSHSFKEEDAAKKARSPRVARWFVFKPKIQIWVNFGGSCNGSCSYIL
jgi:hypothetical protein